ncbi:MAG: hypothetical protein AAF078_06625, partial [Planctomycetota bacterium]
MGYQIVTNTTAIGDVITVQAEDMARDGFTVAHGSNADDGQFVWMKGGDASLTTEFSGATGIYDIRLDAMDENDGVSKIEVEIDGVVVGTIMLDRDSDGAGSNNGHFSTFSLEGIEIPEGATVELNAWRDSGERVRIDKLEFEKVAEVEPEPAIAESVVIQAEDFTHKDGFFVVNGADGQIVKTCDHESSLKTEFTGTGGEYAVTICVQDECDGASRIELWVDGQKVGSAVLDQDGDGWGNDYGPFSEVVFDGVQIDADAQVEIRAFRDGGEFIRIDAVKFDREGEPAEDCEHVVMEAEDFGHKSGFFTVHGDEASGGELVKTHSHISTLKDDFTGEGGVYDVTLSIQDESDGNGRVELFVDGVKVATVDLNTGANGIGSNDSGFTDFTFEDIEVPAGAEIKIKGFQDGNEWVRIDKVEFKKTGECDVCEDKIDFSEFSAG